ncbi:MAG: cytidine deaminase [Breznakibacter sp.]
MLKQELKIPFEETAVRTELSSTDNMLIERSIEALENAYAPYSEFSVGAALLLDNGSVVTGNNQENAAYPSGLCAERVALFYANAQYPQHKIVKLAIAAAKNGRLCDSPITPCGACRQVMLESEHRQNQPYEVILVGNEKVVKIGEARYLLPFAFDSDSLS